eukprot:256143-Pyramimonas_sp.AAC.1
MQVFNFLTGLQVFLTHSPSGLVRVYTIYHRPSRFPHSQAFKISHRPAGLVRAYRVGYSQLHTTSS